MKEESWKTSRFSGITSWVSARSIGQNKGYQRRDRLGEATEDLCLGYSGEARTRVMIPLQVVVYQGRDFDDGVPRKWQGELWGTSNCMSWLSHNSRINVFIFLAGEWRFPLQILGFHSKTLAAFFYFSPFLPLMSLSNVFFPVPLKSPRMQKPSVS